MDGKTSKAWEALFRELPLRAKLEADGRVDITAKEIDRIGNREPRLMTKFDSRSSRPEPLDGVTVLPITNGGYALVKGDGYHDLEAGGGVTPHSAARLANLKTIQVSDVLESESQALDVSFISSMLRAFTGENELFLTIRGRLRTPRFEFAFQGADRVFPFVADGVQVEVDAGFEGDRVYVIEAKLGARDDFHVRQLYYPFRMWSERAGNKKIVPVFMAYANRVFTFWEYRFRDAGNYHSIELVKRSDYVLDAAGTVPTLAQAIADTTESPLGDAPFPQANDLDKVLDAVDAVGAGVMDKEDIADRFDYDERQADYYGNAAAFLGYLRRETGGFLLTPTGKAFISKPHFERLADVVRRVVSLPVFRETAAAVAAGADPSTDEIAETLQRRTAGISGTTLPRRAQTVQRWIQWLNRVGR